MMGGSVGGGPSSTRPRGEKDFCLIAEAAKRAQVAVLARDMGDIGLN